MLGGEAIVSQEAQQYLGVNPATIALLKDGTRELIWGLTGNGNNENYHTIRWFSDNEKRRIQELEDMKAIQDFLNHYI